MVVMIMVDWDNCILMLPGPVKIHQRVLRVMSLPVRGHRTDYFRELHEELKTLLQYLFQTKNEVVILTGSGTAGVEAAISNIVKKGDKILNIYNGKFGERIYEISKVYGTALPPITAAWGKPIELDAIATVLETTDDVKVVTLCHNETSTGMTNHQVREIGRLAKKHDALFVLDAITSAGGIEVKPEEFYADIVVTGSQKCIGAPPGLSCLSVSARAQEALHEDTSYYLNLRRHIEKSKTQDAPWTPALPLFEALREALRMLQEEGLENRIKRTAKLADATREAVRALGLTLFPAVEYASNTVTAINYPLGIDDKQFRTALATKYNVIIAGGQEHLRGKIFRIAHMGICSFNELTATFAAIEATLRDMGHKFEVGAGIGKIIDNM
jgi:aspartate aminotransferase-like enzyme